MSRDFRLLWFGRAVSVLGDQFHLIALPWLVLQLTGDGAAMGAVLAAAAFPRALLMLVGGLLTDRASPRCVLLASDLARALVVGTLAALVFSGLARMWAIYLCAFLFGLCDAAAFPAQAAIVPRVVPRDEIARGNALIAGGTRTSAILGPALAGVLIAAGTGETMVRGIALAMGIDALTFLISVATLWPIREAPATGAVPCGRALSQLTAGFGFLRDDPPLRALMPFFVCMSFIAAGVINAGLPLLAERRFDGAESFGAMLSALALGSIAGALAVALLPPPPRHRIAAIAMLLFAVFGAGIQLLAYSSSLRTAAGVLACMGACGAYAEVQVIAWVQARVPSALLGRVMSMLMFCTMGLAPVSMVLFGGLLDDASPATLATIGALYMLLGLSSLGVREVRSASLPDPASG